MPHTPTTEQQHIYNFVQLEAGHGIINAVAGSGKTTTIVNSVQFIDQTKKALFCAFNKSIRDVIKGKISADNVDTHNLHQMGYQVIRQALEKNPVVKQFRYKTIIKSFFTNEFQDEVIQYLELDGFDSEEEEVDDFALKRKVFALEEKFFTCLNMMRLTLTKPEIDPFLLMLDQYGILQDRGDQATRIRKATLLLKGCIRCLELGMEEYNRNGAIDFSDMLYYPIKLNYPPTRLYDIVFVDECQDLSKSQFALAMKFVKERGRVIAVGDPSQAIYGFTGADIESFSRFEDHLTNPTSLSLTACFRCPSNVIALARNYREDITAFEERNGIIGKLDFEQVLDKAQIGDLIISRRKAPLAILLFDFLDNDIKVDVHEDDRTAMVQQLRSMFNQREQNLVISEIDIEEFFIELKRRKKYQLKKRFEEGMQDDEMDDLQTEQDWIVRKLDFVERWIRNTDGLTYIKDVFESLKKMMNGGPNSIKLSTIHRAKGLENDRVFILEYDRLPMERTDYQDWENEQEKNLKYVAITRAKNELYLVNSEGTALDDDEASLFDTMDFDI